MLKIFTPEEEALIVAAIRKAEASTTGEIRVHLEENLVGEALETAQKTFLRLGMHRTKDRNGVLLLIAPQQRKLAIIGDSGMDAVVPPDFWVAERDLLQRYFSQGAYCAGVVAAIDQVGEKLKAYFPGTPDDTNELDDSVSYGTENK